MTIPKQNTKEVIEEFDELFPFQLYWEGAMVSKNKAIKQFLLSSITKAVKERDEEILNKIQELKQLFKVSENMELREAYNGALEDIKNLINKEDE